MRLINTTSLKLQEFDMDVPPYAILSHTWAEDEVSYLRFREGLDQRNHGCQKVAHFCSLSKALGVEWAWTDTCCINQDSAAEVDEAVNSMFGWYRASAICFAYLEDVSLPWTEAGCLEQFRRSRWFTRSWTLPELLAPSQVWFLNQHWEYIGCKGTEGGSGAPMGDLNEQVSTITGIPVKYLLHFDPPTTDATVNERLGWALKRRASRIEDVAYSLMGILDVIIPSVYGEGARAFDRLMSTLVSATFSKHVDARAAARSSGIFSQNADLISRRLRPRQPGASIITNYTLTSDGLTYLNGSINDETGQSHRPAQQTQRGPHRDTLSSSAPGASGNSIPLDSSQTEHNARWPVCWLLIAFSSLIIGGSLTVGLYYSIAKDRMGDGFTAAGYIIAVGTLILAVPITKHHPHCRCWKSSVKRDADGIEMHPAYR